MSVRFSLLLAMVAVLMLAVGCGTSMKRIGVIGTTEFYSAHASQFDGPNFTGLILHNTETGEIKIPQVFGSGGIGAAVISGAASVGASAALGISLPRNPDSVVNSTVNADTSSVAVTDVEAEANAGANASASSAAQAVNTNTQNGKVHPVHPPHPKTPKPPKEHGHGHK